MTRFALISDVHANVEALEAVFRKIDALGFDEIYCLGDIIGYGADPEACTRMIMQRCRWSIMGNHDYGLTSDLRDFNPLAANALALTRRRLKPSLLSFGKRAIWNYLTNLPHTMSAHGFEFFHGSPRDPIMEYVLKTDGFLEPEKMAGIFARLRGPCFVGHTHWPGVHDQSFRFHQATDERRVYELDGEPVVVNVGSVGQPRDGDPRACFATVDGQRVEFHRVPYDFRRTQEKIRAAGHHPALADRLAIGK
ncbi:MAG: metallophosphoesterase family protein [Planctomycetota bacterium]